MNVKLNRSKERKVFIIGSLLTCAVDLLLSKAHAQIVWKSVTTPPSLPSNLVWEPIPESQKSDKSQIVWEILPASEVQKQPFPILWELPDADTGDKTNYIRYIIKVEDYATIQLGRSRGITQNHPSPTKRLSATPESFIRCSHCSNIN